MKPDEGTFVVTMELAEHNDEEETIEVIDDGSGAEGAETPDEAASVEEEVILDEAEEIVEEDDEVADEADEGDEE